MAGRVGVGGAVEDRELGRGEGRLHVLGRAEAGAVSGAGQQERGIGKRAMVSSGTVAWLSVSRM